MHKRDQCVDRKIRVHLLINTDSAHIGYIFKNFPYVLKSYNPSTLCALVEASYIQYSMS